MTIDRRRTFVLAVAAGIALAAWGLWQFAMPPVQSTATTTPAGTTASGTDYIAAPSTVDTVQRIAASGLAAERRRLRCQLIGLHTAASWTTAVQLQLENAAGLKAELRATPEAGGALAFEMPEWTTSGSFDARFAAEDPNYLTVDVREHAPDRETGPLAVDVYPIPVEPVAVCTGKVVDFRGTPVPAARVAAFRWRRDQPHEPRFATDTAADGTFLLRVPLAAELLVVAVAMAEADPEAALSADRAPRDDLLAASAHATVAFGVPTDVGTLTLPPSALITGELRDPQGRPVVDAFVHWWPEGAMPASVDRTLIFAGTATWRDLIVKPTARTDQQGRFRLAARAGASGTLYVTDRHQRREPLVEHRRVTAPADVTIQLAGNTIVLRVVRAGVPVPHVVVKLDREDPGGTPLSTDDHGELRLLREHARAETVSLRPQGRLPLSVELPLDTAPDQPIVIEIGGVPTAPIVFDVTSAVPVQQFSAGFKQVGASVFAAFCVALDPAAGEFRTDGGVAAGEYVLHVAPPAEAASHDRFLLSQWLRVRVSASAARVPLVLRHGGLIRVRVRHHDGVPVAGIVSLTGPDQKSFKPGLVQASGEHTQDGHLPANTSAITSNPLAPGRWEVTLDLGGRGEHRRTVEVRPCEIADAELTLR